MVWLVHIFLALSFYRLYLNYCLTLCFWSGDNSQFVNIELTLLQIGILVPPLELL